MNNPSPPKGERLWTSYYDQQHQLRFLLTSKAENRNFYFLYKLVDGKPCKLGKARFPSELEQKYQVAQALKGASP